MRFSTILAATAFLALSAPAFAEGPSMTVSARGLDLTSQSGIASFNQRVRHAAVVVCAQSDLRGVADADRCRAMTLAELAPQVHAIVAHAQLQARLAANDIH